MAANLPPSLPTSAPTSGAKSKPVPGDAPIFEVRGLVKHYPIGGGLRLRRNAGFIQAVDGVDFGFNMRLRGIRG